MNKCFFIVFTLILLLFTSCKKKDFSLNSEYEDVTIIYGFLDPNDTIHYLKIYKSFLTEGDAYEAAKDINNYSYIDSIEVKMEEYNGKQLLRTITFDTTTAIPKDSGTFAYPLQVLYKSNAIINRNYTYKIIVRNRYTEKTTVSQTPIVGTVSVKSPIYYQGKKNSITFLPRQQQLEFEKSENISYCQAAFYYYYTEVFKDGKRKQADPVIWEIGDTKTDLISYYGENLLRKIHDKIKVNDNIDYRITDSIVLHLYTASNDLYLYILSISASTGLNQERLEYTNVKSYSYEDGSFVEDGNALGVFSSRGHFSLMYDEFSKATNDSLLYGRYTSDLKFKTYDY